jgi:hypothetical protein
VLGSAFDDDKPYELTELGDQFVRYALDEAIPRLTAHGAGSPFDGDQAHGDEFASDDKAT